MTTIKRHRVGVAHAGAAENVQRRPDGQVNLSLPQSRDLLQIMQRVRAAGVSCWNGRPATEFFDQFAVNTVAQTLHVRRMNQEFGAAPGEFLQRLRCDGQFRELLPAIGDDKIFTLDLGL